MSKHFTLPRDYVVRRGDCIASIAFRHGHFPDYVWNHEGNESLREARENPNMLVVGDVVRVPERRSKTVDAAIDRTHRFRRRGVPEKLRFRVQFDAEQRPGEEIVVTVDGEPVRATTDGEGGVELWVRPDAKRATAVIGEQEYELHLGSLPPSSEPSGVAARLVNLGFLEHLDDVDEDDLHDAIELFQSRHGLKMTGEIDDELLTALEAQHGS